LREHGGCFFQRTRTVVMKWSRVHSGLLPRRTHYKFCWAISFSKE
jgi:hypothetical protein